MTSVERLKRTLGKTIYRVMRLATSSREHAARQLLNFAPVLVHYAPAVYLAAVHFEKSPDAEDLTTQRLRAFLLHFVNYGARRNRVSPAIEQLGHPPSAFWTAIHPGPLAMVVNDHDPVSNFLMRVIERTQLTSVLSTRAFGLLRERMSIEEIALIEDDNFSRAREIAWLLMETSVAVDTSTDVLEMLFPLEPRLRLALRRLSDLSQNEIAGLNDAQIERLGACYERVIEATASYRANIRAMAAVAFLKLFPDSIAAQTCAIERLLTDLPQDTSNAQLNLLELVNTLPGEYIATAAHRIVDLVESDLDFDPLDDRVFSRGGSFVFGIFYALERYSGPREIRHIAERALATLPSTFVLYYRSRLRVFVNSDHPYAHQSDLAQDYLSRVANA